MGTYHNKLIGDIFVIKVTLIMIDKRELIIISEKGKHIMICVVDPS